MKEGDEGMKNEEETFAGEELRELEETEKENKLPLLALSLSLSMSKPVSSLATNDASSFPS